MTPVESRNSCFSEPDTPRGQVYCAIDNFRMSVAADDLKLTTNLRAAAPTQVAALNYAEGRAALQGRKRRLKLLGS